MKNIYNFLTFIVLIFLFVSCQTGSNIYNGKNFVPVTNSNESPIIQFIVDETDEQTLMIYKEFFISAQYAKFPIKKINEKDFNIAQKIPTSVKILAIERTFGLNEKSIEALHEFVATGGTLFLTNTNWDERMAFLMGLKPNYKMDIDAQNSGLFFQEYVLPGLKGKGFDVYSSNAHGGLKSSNFSINTTTLVSATTDKSYPVILENKVGNGKVILKNSNDPLDKTLRGILFSQLLNGLEGVPYPIVNSVSIQLDDFPSPLYKIKKEPIKSEMDITIAKFVTNVWWPDMKNLAKEMGIKYTAYPAFNYDNNTAPPFTFQEWDRNSFIKDGNKQTLSNWLGREVIESGHELGFHGYNHVSLLASDWKKPEFIITALNTAKKKWKTSGFKDLPISYVPPSNYIDSIGLAKLAEGMPSLRYMQSTYFGELEDGGDREFDVDPLNDHFFDFPRATSGYTISDAKRMTVNSLFLNTGIWTHFMHADDVFQIPDESNALTAGHFEYRNQEGLNWHTKDGKLGMLDRLKAEIKTFKKTFPQAQFYTAKEATEETIKWRYAPFSHVKKEGLYIVHSEAYVNNDNQVQYWFVYASKENEDFIEKELSEISLQVSKTDFLHGKLFMVKTRDAFIALPDYKEVKEVTKAAAISAIKKELILFQEARLALTPLMDKVAHYVSIGNLKEATNTLEKYVLEGNTMLISQWKEYATYKVWQDKGDDVWRFLEEEYAKNPTKENSELSRKLQEIAPYSTNEVREKWLSRQINWDSKDVSVLKEYIDYFRDGTNTHLILKAYKDLLDIEPIGENREAFITFLLDTKNKETFDFLNEIPVCDEKFQNLATQIAWTYADDLNYVKALEWKACSNEIDKETEEFWLVNSEKFEELKETNYAKYISILLVNEPKRAVEQLRQSRVCVEDLKPLARKISMLFGDYAEYKAAVSWSECAENIPVKNLLTWHYETSNLAKMKRVYDIYIEDNLEDNDVKLHMGKLLMYSGNLFAVAAVAHGMDAGIGFSELRGLLNKNVVFLSTKEKRLIISKYPHLFSEKVKNVIKEEIRLEKGHDIVFETISTNDRLDPTALNFKGGFSLYDKNRNTHEISVVRGFVFPVGFRREDKINSERDLIGLEFRFDKAQNNLRNLFFKFRIEGDNANETFFHAGAGINFSKKYNFYSLEAVYRPVQTGPGYVLNIYQGQFTSYSELKLSKKISQTFALESNYYSDNEIDGTIMARTSFSLADTNSTWNVSPLAEVAYTLASADKRNGFPYWMAKNRLFGGGGLGLTIGKENSNFFFTGSASYFIENANEPSFERYMGNLNMKMLKYIELSINAEIYTIENFYSNGFSLGLRYHL